MMGMMLCDPMKNKTCSHHKCAALRRGTCAVTHRPECEDKDIEGRYRRTIERMSRDLMRMRRGDKNITVYADAIALMQIYHDKAVVEDD